MTAELTPDQVVTPAPEPAGVAYVTATIAGRQVALPLAALVEVAELAEVTPLPLAPGWLAGVTNLRGSVLPVVDLVSLLGWETGRPGPRALVLRDGRFRLAVPVAAVAAVIWLSLPPVDETIGVLTPHEVTVDGRPTWVVSAEAVLAHVRRGDQAGMVGR